MKKERQFRILNILINYKNVEKEMLISYFDISQKTLNRDFEEINIFLKGLGDFIILDNDNNLEFKGNTENILQKLQLDDNFLMKEERLLYIFLILLRDKKTTKLQLADDLDISLNIIEDDIDELRNICNKQKINLTISKQGLKIADVTEENEIEAVVELTTKCLLFKKVYSILKLNKIEKLFSSYIYTTLKRKYKIDIYNKIFHWIIEYTANHINISNLNAILLSIKITYWLNHSKNSILLEKLKDSAYYNEFIDNIGGLYCSDDINYFLSKKISIDKNKNSVIEFVNNLDKGLFKLFNEKLCLDNNIKERIVNHLASNIYIQNVDEFVIKEYSRSLQPYKKKFVELWEEIEKNLALYFRDLKSFEVLAYEIFIHVLVWFDTYIYNEKLKLLTICIGGFGQSVMIKNHLKSIYRNADVENLPYSSVNKKLLMKYDLVISSIDLSEYKLPNILAMPIILILSKKNDIHKIISEKIYRKLIGEKMETQILKAENILIKQKAKSKIDAIKQCGNLLIEQGYITEDYVNSMIEREKKFSVYIGNYLAIPHGINDEGVIKDGIVIVHYDEPVDYDSNPVHFFIGIAAKSNNHVDILSNIAEKMMDIDFVEDLIKNPSKDRILKEFNF